MQRSHNAAEVARATRLCGNFALRSSKARTCCLDNSLLSTRLEILRELGRNFAERLPAGPTRLAGAKLGDTPLVRAATMGIQPSA